MHEFLTFYHLRLRQAKYSILYPLRQEEGQVSSFQFQYANPPHHQRSICPSQLGSLASTTDDLFFGECRALYGLFWWPNNDARPGMPNEVLLGLLITPLLYKATATESELDVVWFRTKSKSLERVSLVWDHLCLLLVSYHILILISVSGSAAAHLSVSWPLELSIEIGFACRSDGAAAGMPHRGMNSSIYVRLLLLSPTNNRRATVQ